MGHSRRSFLTLLGLAPFAAPAAVAAATKPVMARWTTASAPYLGKYGSRILLADEIDYWPGVEGDLVALREQRLLTWPEGPEKDRLRAEVDEFLRTRKTPLALAQWHPDAVTPCCPAFIDDVGSGP